MARRLTPRPATLWRAVVVLVEDVEVAPIDEQPVLRSTGDLTNDSQRFKVVEGASHGRFRRATRGRGLGNAKRDARAQMLVDDLIHVERCPAVDRSATR